MRYFYSLFFYIVCIWPALAISCAPGTYLSVSEQKCAVCPENYYCPGQENIDIYEDRYIAVPYLESDSYSYIDTQIIPTMDKDFYFLGELPENIATNSTQQVAFYWVRGGINNVISYPTYGCIYNPEHPTLLRAYRNSRGDKQLLSGHTQIKALTGQKLEYQTDGEYFYLNGDKYKFPDSYPTELVPYPIYLFKLNEKNSGEYTNNYQMRSGIKIYRWRVTQGDTVLQDLVPVYDPINNEYGMYDIITNQFFGNGNNQGDFIGSDTKKKCSTETNNIAPNSPAGSTSINDCGRVLHLGNYKLYLTLQKRTSPSLVLQYGNNMFYGSMTTDKHGHMRTEYNNTIYSIYSPNID